MERSFGEVAERRTNPGKPEPRLAIVASPTPKDPNLSLVVASAERAGLVPVVLPSSRLLVKPRERDGAVCAIIDGMDPAAGLCATVCSLLIPRARIIFLFPSDARPPKHLQDRGECVAKPLTPFALEELLA